MLALRFSFAKLAKKKPPLYALYSIPERTLFEPRPFRFATAFKLYFNKQKNLLCETPRDKPPLYALYSIPERTLFEPRPFSTLQWSSRFYN